MKKLFTILCVTLISLSMSAQAQFGIEAGLNMSNISGSDHKDYFGYSTEMRVGLRLGGTVAFTLSDAVTLKTGLIYSVKGWESTMDIVTYDPITGFIYDVSAYDYSQSLNYLEVPMNFSFAASDQFSLVAGPYFAFLMGATTYVGDESESTNTDGMRSMDIGINLGAGVAVTEAISINAGYSIGLTSLDEDGDGDSKNSNIHIGMTYSFGG